jgi:hypothetical protein
MNSQSYLREIGVYPKEQTFQSETIPFLVVDDAAFYTACLRYLPPVAFDDPKFFGCYALNPDSWEKIVPFMIPKLVLDFKVNDYYLEATSCTPEKVQETAEHILADFRIAMMAQVERQLVGIR